MIELREAEIFEGLSAAELEAIEKIARPQSFRAGEYLFLLGDSSDRLYIVRSGTVDLCFPFSFHGTVKDITVESKRGKSAVGWSAFIRPYRFTLSARAVEATETYALLRRDLEQLFEESPRTGYFFLRRIGELVGRRLLQMQALWARELQRAVGEQLRASPERTPT